MDEKEDIVVNVGDVVYAKYLTSNGEEKLGYFIVISKDSFFVPSFSGYNALKISSNPAMYQIELDAKRFTFLQHTSYINCGHQQRLYPALIVKNLGVVSADILYRIGKQLENFNKDIDKQLDATMKYFNRITRAVDNREKFYNEQNGE